MSAAEGDRWLPTGSPRPSAGWPCEPPVPGVRRLSVLRSGGLGDLIGAEPALAALRAGYPDAELTLLCGAAQRDLATSRPGPWDRVVVVPSMPGLRSGSGRQADPAEVETWCARQRGRAADLAVQLHGGGEHSNRLLARLGAAVTAGVATGSAPRPDRWIPWSAYQLDTLRWLEVAAACGAPPGRLTPRIERAADDAAAARALVGDPGGYAVVHPGSADPRRRWLPDRFAGVCDALAAAGAPVLLVAGPGERALLAEVGAAAVSGPRTVVTGSLPALAGVLAGASIMVGVDSGPRHLAAALGTPTVGVFSRANAVDVTPLLRSWHRVAVSWRSSCERCGRPMEQPPCGHADTVLGDVTADEVAALAVGLWRQAAAAARTP